MFTFDRPQHANFSHKYSISCVQWYVHDNGLFTTSSTDQSLKIWDSNALRVCNSLVCIYKCVDVTLSK